MITGGWKTATLTYGTHTTLTPEVDLGGTYEFLLVLIPTITNSTTSIQVAEASGGTFFPLYALDDDATGCFAHATTQATTTMAVVFRIGGAQFVKVLFGSAQGGDSTIKIQGFDRG